MLRSGYGWRVEPQAAAFEKEVAAYCDAPHALAANSGTAAMHLALAGSWSLDAATK